MDDAEVRYAAEDQGDVHGEFVAVFHELLGAVQGVDEKEALPGQAVLGRRRRGLLGDDGDVGEEAGQAVQDDPVRGQVGLGHRRAVGLVDDAAARGAYGHAGPAGLGG